MEISRELLLAQDSITSTVLIRMLESNGVCICWYGCTYFVAYLSRLIRSSCLHDCAHVQVFVELAKADGDAILQRDNEDAEKLAR